MEVIPKDVVVSEMEEERRKNMEVQLQILSLHTGPGFS